MQGGGPIGQGAGQRGGVVALQMLRCDAGEPVVFVRREHPIRRSGSGQDFPAFKHNVVLAGVQGDSGIGQVDAHPGVARQRLRLVIVGGKHRLGAKRLGQGHDFLARQANAHDQARAR